MSAKENNIVCTTPYFHIYTPSKETTKVRGLVVYFLSQTMQRLIEKAIRILNTFKIKICLRIWEYFWAGRKK